MGINRALKIDSTYGGVALQELDKILSQLQTFKSKYPQTFRYLCQAAIATGEMSESGLNWPTDYLMGDE
jgi:hypothetical protein